jgi:hypothetical protein
MSIFGNDKGNAMKRQSIDSRTSTFRRKMGLMDNKTVVQKANVEKRVKKDGQKSWYKFAYWQEMMADVFNIYNQH